MNPMDAWKGRVIGSNGPNEEEMRRYQEMQRIAHIEMYRQVTAQQCLVALIVKSMAIELNDGEATPVKTLAKRAKLAADALCVEFFGEDSIS